MKTAVLVAVMLMIPAAQRRPDFSGTWVLDEALVIGASRGGSESSEPRRTSAIATSGAAFNCGKGCTIRQKGMTLTVDTAELPDYKGKDPSLRTPPVTFTLDGKEVSLVDSFSPGRRFPVASRWQGATILIETKSYGSLWQQTLSLEGQRLVVRTGRAVQEGEPRSDLILKYRRK